MLHNGLYEQVINNELNSELAATDKLSQTAPIDEAEASKVLAKYIAEVVEPKFYTELTSRIFMRRKQAFYCKKWQKMLEFLNYVWYN